MIVDLKKRIEQIQAEKKRLEAIKARSKIDRNPWPVIRGLQSQNFKLKMALLDISKKINHDRFTASDLNEIIEKTLKDISKRD